MSIQDGQNTRRRIVLGRERMRAYRLGQVLCGQGHQQEDDGWQGTHGQRQLLHPYLERFE